MPKAQEIFGSLNYRKQDLLNAGNLRIAGFHDSPNVRSACHQAAFNGRVVSEIYPVAVTFAKGKKWRPGGNKPYLDVLFALAKNPDLVISYDKILNLVPDRRRPGVKAIRPRIAEVIHDSSRNVDLRKQLAFEFTSGFTVEDPLFRYFLSNMKEEDIYRQLGIESDDVERARAFSYDIGFSFAGESRRLIELINSELKSEDVLTL